MNGHAPEKGYFLATGNRVNGYAPEYVHEARHAIVLHKLNKKRAKYPIK